MKLVKKRVSNQDTCQLKIWEKGEHDHSKDISKTIPVAAAKTIKETLKLPPLGQCASKLHKVLNQSSATRLSHTVTQQTESALLKRLMLHTDLDKVIELHLIKLDNTYGSVQQVQFLHCNFTANYFVNLSCRFRVTGLDGPPIHRAFESAQ